MQLHRVLITSAAVAAISSLLWHGKVNADVLDHQQSPLLSKAERALEHGNPGRTVSLLHRRLGTLRGGPERAQGYALLCRAQFDLGAIDRAEEHCDAAVREGGGAATWSHLNNRGVMRLVQGRTDEALADFHAAQRANPLAREVDRNLALVN